jgi:hypothetical protein
MVSKNDFLVRKTLCRLDCGRKKLICSINVSTSMHARVYFLPLPGQDRPGSTVFGSTGTFGRGSNCRL